jgi:resuscitation-promoting factor RpfA
MAHEPRHRAVKPVRRSTRRIMTTTAALAAAVAAPMVAAGPAQAASDSTWNELAQCESSGDWHINTGNGYYGGLQFSDSTWDSFGGERYAATADQASREQQIQIAEKVLDTQGWGAWPACSSELGLTSADAGGTPTAPTSASRGGDRSATDDSTASGDYTVQAGDTLSKIARANGTSWRALWEINADEVSDPNLIFVGQQLDLP